MHGKWAKGTEHINLASAERTSITAEGLPYGEHTLAARQRRAGTVSVWLRVLSQGPAAAHDDMCVRKVLGVGINQC